MSHLETMPGHLIRRLQQISMGRFSARMAEAGLDLTSVQYAALLTLQDHPDLDQQTLAGMIAYDRVTLGAVIDRLVQRGLIERGINPDDRRARVLRLTTQGHEMIALASGWVEKVQEDLLALLAPEEQATFLALLTKATASGNALSRAPFKGQASPASAKAGD
ncbi:MarR family winged helix-turn-helix transcriptional regulator [Novosphingobium terrae]|uniref:MarR family winged helix-turn-helix transcriptional regulator n=1 Tax=Novosphingobium terrae TaxID=2726189 RepID=UPI001981188C|nr:MarR family winged helix-turn-helix transcriptional regulator [Novosphingobium terrae]